MEPVPPRRGGGAVSSVLIAALALSLAGGAAGARVPGGGPAAAPRPAGAPEAPPPQAAEAPLYEEVTEAAGIRHRHARPVLDEKLTDIMPWMTALGAAACTADYDRDGRLDLFATSSRKGEPNFLYRNDGDGTFTEVAAEAGVAAWNDDGGVAMDCVWGARVTVTTAAGTQIRERDGGDGFAGQSDPRLHFGLGDAVRVERLEVRWPDGGVQVLEDVAADRHLTIRQDPEKYEGRGPAEAEPEPHSSS